MVFYEAPHKLKATLKDFEKTFGEAREIALVKEITKLHETVLKTTVGEAVKYYEENLPKGEFVIILAGAEKKREEGYTVEQAVEIAKGLIAQGLSASAAAKEAHTITGMRKNEIYRLLNSGAE